MAISKDLPLYSQRVIVRTVWRMYLPGALCCGDDNDNAEQRDTQVGSASHVARSRLMPRQLARLMVVGIKHMLA